MQVRKADKNDVNGNLLNLYIDGFNMHYNQRKDIFNYKNAEELKRDLTNLLDNSSKIILILEQNDIVLGYTILEIKNRATKSVWIDEIVIDEKNRNNGYGKYLINETFQFAKDNDCQRVELNCWSFNDNALKFYDKIGFEQQRIVLEKEVE